MNRIKHFGTRPSWLGGRQASCLLRTRGQDARAPHRLEAYAPAEVYEPD